MQIIDQIVTLFELYATKIPLEVFTFFGAFIEEVIAPVPSPVVLTLAGSAASAQGKAIYYLFWISVVGAIGKTLGAWLLYYLTDKGEDVILGKFGKFLGITHKEIERIGKHFSGGIKDDVILFLVRSIPVVPSAPISIVCGFLKINIKSFILWTFVGSIIRNMIYIYFGFVGLSTYESAIHGLDKVESIIQILIVIAIFILIVWFYKKRKGDSDMIEWLKKKFSKIVK